MTKVIIDTDPGQDDALAILLALASPELEILGITAVAGNVPLPLTEVNARKICELAGRTDVPVFAGAPRPMVRPLVTAEHVHGRTGIDGADLPEPTMPLQDAHAVDFIVDTVMESDEPITLCTLGPLTNIGLALAKEPRICDGIEQLVLMGGGSREGGNVTPAAEFNIYVDPHAAAAVFESGIDLVMHPLDVTHKALVNEDRLARFQALPEPVGSAVGGMLTFFNIWEQTEFGWEGAPLHDPCVIAYLIEPHLFIGQACHVAIEHHSELTMGQTVVDWLGRTGNETNCLVVHDLDADGFFDLIIGRLTTLVP